MEMVRTGMLPVNKEVIAFHSIYPFIREFTISHLKTSLSGKN
jgi:hypothetical protein